MARYYSPYELVCGETTSLTKQFNTIHNIKPIYNKDDYAKESKYRLELLIKKLD